MGQIQEECSQSAAEVTGKMEELQRLLEDHVRLPAGCAAVMHALQSCMLQSSMHARGQWALERGDTMGSPPPGSQVLCTNAC